MVRLPFSTTVVTREEIEKSGATKLEHVLRSVPGLQFGTQGNAFPRIATRGLRDTADVLVLIDGVPFRQLGGAADLTMLPVGIIERVEFTKGPSSALYGRTATAGVLQIFTQPNSDKPVYKQQATVGSYGFRETLASGFMPYKGGKASIQAGLTDSDGFQRDTDREAKFVSANIEQQINDWLTVGVVGSYSQVDARRGSIIPLIGGKPAYGVSIRDNFGVPDARFEGEYSSLSVPIKAELGSGWELRNLFNINRYDRLSTGGITIIPLTNPPPATVTTKNYNEGGSVQEMLQNELIMEWRGKLLGGATGLSFGGSYENGNLDSDNLAFNSQPGFRAPNFTVPFSNAARPPNGVPGALTITDTKQEVGGVFANLDYTIGPFALYGGIRWDTFETSIERPDTPVVAEQDGSKATRRIGASYEIIDAPAATVALFANYTEGFKPQLPALNLANNVFLPQLLNPEFTTSYEGGVKMKALGNRLYAEATVFDMVRDDAQRSFRVNNDFLFTNVEQRIKGVESQVRFQATHNFSGYATYAYQDAVNTKFIVNAAGLDTSGYTIRMAANHFAGAGFDWKFGRFNWNFSGNYVGDRPLRDNIPIGQIQTLPSYLVFNTSVRYEFDNYFAQATVNNLTDEFYISDDFSGLDSGNAGAPREYYFTAGIRF